MIFFKKNDKITVGLSFTDNVIKKKVLFGETIMKKVAVVTDSNSGITQAEAAELGISVLPMPFYIDGKLYFEDINMTQE